MTRPRIHCQFHKESTPSMVLYEDSAHCFGCGITVKLDELDLPKTKLERSFKKVSFKENIGTTLHNIASMPTKPIRGFSLPYDGTGYYLVYPSQDYYIKRMWDADNSKKYKCPSGHTKPLFKINQGLSKEHLIIVEGQLNALTLGKVVTNCEIVSPGGVGDLNSPKFVKYYLQSNKICIIVDKDKAGVLAADELRDTLLQSNRRVSILAMPKDLNDIYITDGLDALKEKAKEALDLLNL